MGGACVANIVRAWHIHLTVWYKMCLNDVKDSRVRPIQGTLDPSSFSAAFNKRQLDACFQSEAGSTHPSPKRLLPSMDSLCSLSENVSMLAKSHTLIPLRVALEA